MSTVDTTPTHTVVFSMAFNNRPIGDIKMNLFGKVAPKTVENFVSIARGTEITDRDDKKVQASYKGSIFHRIIPNFMLQGGDVTNHNGTGGGSIYGGRFPDENFTLKHDRPFLLSMANAGKDTNGSQFFITTVVTDWLDGKHTVFGELADKASKSLAKQLETVGSSSGAPKGVVKVVDVKVSDYVPPKATKDVPIGSKVYMDVQYGSKTGRINFGLFDSVVPKTTANFKSLCEGFQFPQPVDTINGKQSVAGYKGSPFHRIIPDFMLQGGDFTKGNGTGGVSIYGEKFDDENFELTHDVPFLLSMANAGPGTNGSQFFITTVVTDWLDGKHVVFGKVLDENSKKVVKEIEALGSASGKPKESVKVIDSGVINE